MISNALNSKSIFIFGVYLPQQGCSISSFKYHLDILCDLVEQCKLEGEVCIIGDFNCHFSAETGDRFWGKDSRNSKALKEVLSNCYMYVIDGDMNICNGPDYTFYVEGVGKSYIDHCATTMLLKEYIHDCVIIMNV